MATTAVEISAPNTDFVGIPLRPQAPRYRIRSGAASASYTSSVLPLTPPQDALEENVVSVGIPHGSDRATRILNIAVATVALIIGAPLFVLIALAVRLTSRGPIFYKQTRVGLDRRWNKTLSHQDVRDRDLGGRPFTMYKFRTMVIGAEKDSKEVWAAQGDERVTRLGQQLRALRLDELPQLLNVVAGDMNIVGPRPERPGIFAELRETIPNYHLRQRVMPGITGWAQINQSYDTCVDDVRRKVHFDLEYLRTRSVARDLSIMARTLPVMALGRMGW